MDAGGLGVQGQPLQKLVRPYLRNKNINKRLGFKWQTACLACSRTWVQSLAPQGKTEKGKNTNFTTNVLQISTLAAFLKDLIKSFNQMKIKPNLPSISFLLKHS
jgi:hypothetical protein